MTGLTAPTHSNVREFPVFLGNITPCDVNLRGKTKIYIEAVSFVVSVFHSVQFEVFLIRCRYFGQGSIVRATAWKSLNNNGQSA